MSENQPTHDHRGIPIIPKLPENPSRGPNTTGDPIVDPNPVVAVCGECGRDIHCYELYCCLNSRCPIQPKATM